jgi:DNA repair protein RadD
MQLFEDQARLKSRILEHWSLGLRNVLAVHPTGGGKTVLFSSIIHDEPGAVAAIAHRKELVSQISLSLGREGVTHGIVAPTSTIKEICRQHAEELGTVMYSPNSKVKVAGVDTIVRRPAELESWAKQVGLWVTDEAHHLLKKNKWGQSIEMFPNARGLGVTATPVRADRRGLGAHNDGVFHSLAIGSSMRSLIDSGRLTDYRIFAPPSDLDVSGVEIGADGDFKKPQLRAAVQESHIVGDVVEQYLRIAKGKLGVTFATDVQTATDISAKFNAMGVPSEVVDAKTPSRVRSEILRRFRKREILQLVNVDLFGEGFDLPSIEVVSFARPTQSYGLYVQQFGRALRVMKDKDRALIIDHVGNVMRHGLPDREREWSLEAGERRPRALRPEDDIPLRYCTSCTQPYERVLILCPYCGAAHEPAERSKPEHVDGDLYELDPSVLAALRGEISRIDEDPSAVADRLRYAGAGPAAVHGASKQHELRKMAQASLRESMGWWSAVHHQTGRSDREIQRRFYHMFGVDMATAQTLGRPDALKLKQEIDKCLTL